MNRPVAKSPRPILISPVLPRQWLAAGLLGVTAMTLTATGVRAQPICTSEAAPPARHWQERFVPADCGDCWTAPDTAPTEAGAIVLDWVVPGTLGDDAPLSAVARRESVERLDTVGMPPPRRPTARSEALPQMPPFRLRLAQGPVLNGYLGIGIQIGRTPRALDGARLAIALVESLPAGTEGSPVARNLVRNVYYPAWKGRFQLSKTKQTAYSETRTMNVPDGAQPDRLRLVAWVMDRQGRTVAAYQTQCDR